MLTALEAPDWHGRNLNALPDGLSRELLCLDRPLELVIRGRATPKVHDLLVQMQSAFASAREDRGEDVVLTLS